MTHLFFYDLEEKELVVIMPRHGKVSDMDRMWCGDEGKGIFFSCVYQIRDRRYTKGTQRSEKEREKKDYEIFGERKKGKIAKNHLNPLIYKANVIFQ